LSSMEFFIPDGKKKCRSRLENYFLKFRRRFFDG